MLQVRMSKDKLTAYIQIPQGVQPTEQQIRQALADATVRHGLLDDIIVRLGKVAPAGSYEIARGVAPVNGTDAKIEYFFRVGRPVLTPKVLEDGRVDYFNLDVVANVPAGTVLARKIPPVPGKMGKAVTGEDLSPRVPREAKLKPGKNTILTDDELMVVATGKGEPRLERGAIHVITNYIVEGDVDFGVGNIDFEGDVEIRGDVKNKFVVKATGNIHVKGAVDGATVMAGRDLIVAGGVRQNAVLDAGGDALVSFMESSQARVRGNLTVQEDLLFSDVEVGGECRINGSLVGGECRVDVLLVVKTIGSKMGTATTVLLTPRDKWVGQLTDLTEQIKTFKSNIEKMSEHLQSLESVRVRLKRLTPEQSAVKDKLEQTSEVVKLEMATVAKKIMQVRAHLDSLPQPKVEVGNLVRSGVTIRIHDAVMVSKSDQAIRGIQEEKGAIRFW
ncbi:MAG: FapA family protein [Candidatus Sericytochromatia bacterium]|nr:FapA family protein [Candidatus Sericytochromatia bacterium]